VNAQAGQSGAVNKTSLESMAQDDDFQEVKRCKRHISNNTSQTAKSRLNLSHYPQLSCSLKKQCQLATSSHLSELLTQTLRLPAQRTLPVHTIPRKPGRPSPMIITSTTNLIRQHEFRNTQNGTCIIRKEMADY
jgi:hypothetical protein